MCQVVNFADARLVKILFVLLVNQHLVYMFAENQNVMSSLPFSLKASAKMKILTITAGNSGAPEHLIQGERM
jgi:hypothetical protein